MKKFLIFAFAVVVAAQSNAQLAVTTTTPEDAVDFLVGNGVQYSNVTFTGDPAQLGYFTGGAGSFAFGSGILLCTADAPSNVPGSFETGLTSATSGNADLLTIAQSVPPLIGQTFSVSSANDVAILEFDFIPNGDTIEFNYIFGSDEYLEWVNSSYNDVFAFFIAGPGLAGPFSAPAGFPDGSINIAFIPNTDPQIPITISSVNNALYSEYYIDNPTDLDVSLDGYTVSMQAIANVQCGQTYHIRLAIADGSDTALKSTVCFEEGSFASTTTLSAIVVNPPIVDWPTNQLLEGCISGEFVITVEDLSNTIDTIFFEFGGTAINGVDYETIQDYLVVDENVISDTISVIAIDDAMAEGIETLIFMFPYLNGCDELDTAYAEIQILDQEPLSIEPISNIPLCGPINVTANVSGGTMPYTYFWSIDEVTQTVQLDALGDYDVTVTDFCGQTDTEEFEIVEPAGVQLNLDDDTFVCLDATVDVTVEIVVGAPPYQYSWTGSNSTNQTATFDAQDAGMQYVTVSDNCDQTSMDSVLIVIPTLLTGVADLELCVAVATGSLAQGGTTPYNYVYEEEVFEPSESGVLIPMEAGTFEIEVIDACGQQVTIPVVVEVCDTKIPNVFTPNGDGLNDSFEVEGIVNFPQSNLWVYNRWGNIIFEATSYSNNWSGKDCPDGVYFFILKRSDGETFEGHVQILRD